jgi:hypothetical protein
MIKAQKKILLTQILTIILIVSSFHYFTPISNRTIDDQCCASGEMQCCRGDFPSRMVCCIDQGEQDSGNSVPTQGIPEHSFSKIFILFTPLTLASFTLPTNEYLENLSPLQFIVEDNHRYLKLSSFLI